MQCVLVIVTGLTLAQFASAQAQPAAQERFFKVPANTAVRVRTINEISSETAHVGDDVQMEVLGDVAVNGQVVIRQGAPAIAQISAAKEARTMGRHGHVALTLKYIEAVTGEHIPAIGGRNEKANPKTAETTAEVVATSVLMGPPIAALWVFNNGPESKIPPGTAFSVYTASDTMIDLSMITGAAVPPSIVANAAIRNSEPGALPRETPTTSVTVPSLGIVAITRVNVGAEITGIVRDSAAEKAGLRVGDIINAINRHPVRTAPELAAQLWNVGPGSSVRIGYVYSSETFNGKNGNALVYYPTEKVIVTRQRP